MKAIKKIYYYFILIIFRLLTFLPLRVLYIISDVIYLIIYNLLGYRKKVVFENLQKSFPEKSDKQIEHIARKYYRNLSAMIVENIYLRFASVKSLKKRVFIENEEVINNLFKQGKSVIVMSAHLGNWEFGTFLEQLLQHTVVGVYKQLSSVVFDRIFFDIRSRFGSIPIEMKEVIRKMLIFRKKDKPYAIFMVADQTPSSNENIHWLTFLNQDTNVFLGSEKLAKKFDMPVVYFEIIRHKKGVYRMVFKNITTTPTQTKPFDITKEYFKLLEESINRNPSDWLWSHKRWKHKRNV